MKQTIKKKTFSVLTAVLLVFSLLSTLLLASASSIQKNTDNNPVDNDHVRFEATRTDDTIKVAMIADEDMSIGGIMGAVKYGNNVERESINVQRFTGKDYYETNDKFAFTVDNLQVKAEEEIWSLTVTITDPNGFQVDTDYTVTIDLEEVMDGDQEDYTWGEDEFKVIYREDTISDSYTVKYVTDDVNNPFYTETVTEGKAASGPSTEPTRDGYDFAGWSEDNLTVYDFTQEVKGNLTLKALWKKTTATVTFTANGETVKTEEVKLGEYATAPADPTLEGNDFAGWSIDGKNAVDVTKTPINEATNFTALWDKIEKQGNHDVDLQAIKVTKTITSADGVTVPLVDFSFTYEPIDGAPNVGAPFVTGEGYAALGTVHFDKGGLYQYKVYETQDNTDPDWTYSNAQYYLFIQIEEDGDGNLIADSIFTTDATNTDKTAKCEPVFNNTYAPETKLTVSKTVEGEALNKDKEFSFQILFTDPGVGKDVSLVEDSTTTPVAYGSQKVFTLKDGESATFNLPAGTKYTVVESGEEYYTGTASVISGSAEAATQEGKYAQDLEVNSVALVGANSVKVVNKYNMNPLMGVVHKYGAVIVAMLIALAAIVAIVWDRKRKLQNEQ